MTDDNQCAVELRQPLFENFQRFHVEIVGWFVEYEQVCGPGKQPGENDAVAFAAGYRLHRRHGAFWREQEALEVANDVPVPAVELDVGSATADILGNRFFFFEGFAQLVEVADFQPRAELDSARLRLELAEQQTQQRGLADTVITDQPEDAYSVTAHDLDGEVVD